MCESDTNQKNKKMKTELVLVERIDKTSNTIIASSGILLNDRFVITTANVVSDIISDFLFQGQESTGHSKNVNITFTVVQKQDKFFKTREAKLMLTFSSDNIKNSNVYLFKSWAVDSIDNNRNISKSLSLFLVLNFNHHDESEDFKNALKQWWDQTVRLQVKKADSIYVRSVPYGNRNFINSLSKGIVSNTIGKSSCMILSDCPLPPGCEGSPVYAHDGECSVDRIPIGIVVSCINWWRGEWIGMTVIADIKCIIAEYIDIPIKVLNGNLKNENFALTATVENCLAQLYCGSYWGTSVLICEDQGILLTNSHVVENSSKLSLYHKGQSCCAELLYRTPDSEVFDIAIIRAEPSVVKNKLGLRSIRVSEKKCKPGDAVFSAGFSLFAKESNVSSPSVSMGCVSQCNPFMLKTTCCVLPGSSGGVILDENGGLLGIIVSNTKLRNSSAFSRLNMAIPFSAVSEIIFRFLKTMDLVVLNNLHVKNSEAEFIWKRLEGKL